MVSWFALSLAVLVGVVSSQSTAGGYAQCGGVGYTGATTCGAGWYCAKLNDYYSQCLPGDATTTAASTTLSATTTTSSPTSTSASGTTSTGPSPTASGTGPGTTLLPDYYWIRSVEDPNFHKYLQSEVLRTATDAVMGDYTTAGQFNIVNGQLVQLIDTAGTLLYAHVAEQVDDARTLLVSWETTPDTYGTFAFQGDAVTWTTPTINRPNTAAWLVCTGQLLYINTGAYDYDTPSGCADETIHYYNGATAVD